MVAQFLKHPDFFRRKTEVAPDDIFDVVPVPAGD